MPEEKTGQEVSELVTIVIIAYEQEQTIREAIEGAFAQDYAHLEVLLSDDASTDGTFEIMKEMVEAYSGPHEVVLNRNEKNLGLIGHINRINELSRGVLIVANAGDDISEPTRVSELYEAFKAERPLLLDSELHLMRADGKLKGRVHSRKRIVSSLSTLNSVSGSMRSVIGASCAWSSELHRLFGPITEAGTYEDQVMFFRARLAGRVAHVPLPLVRYRDGGMSRSGDSLENRLHKMNVKRATLRQRSRDISTYLEAMRVDLDTEIQQVDRKIARIKRKIQKQQ